MGVRSVKIGQAQRPIRFPHEAVKHAVRVKVESCDLSLWADCETLRALAGCCARTRRVEDGETAIMRPDETVPHIIRVTDESYDCPRRIDVEGKGPLIGPRAGTRRVKGGNGLRRYCDENCQGDQDGCRRLEFPFCEIEWFYTP